MDWDVTRSAEDTMLEAARRAHPHEACGLLLGRAPGRIERAVPAANVAPDPARRFEIDPAALIAAFKAERAGGPRVLGYWHSHPNGIAAPSATDRGAASGDGRVWAIVAGPAIGWWRDTADGFVALSTRQVDG